MQQVFDCNKLTDMEIALSLMRLMDDPELNKEQRTSNIKNICVQMVERAVETFTNPFAKNLLRSKLAEQVQY